MATPLIPRRVLFGNPGKASPTLSPDGLHIAFLAPVEGVLNVWVGPASDPGAAEPVTQDAGRGIRLYFWAFTNNHLIYLQDKGGDENWRVYAVGLETREVIDLTPLENVQAQIVGISSDHPDEIIVGLNDRNPQYHDLYSVNVRTGQRELLHHNDRFAEFLVDHDYQVRFGTVMTPDGGSEVFETDGQGGWATFMRVGNEDALTTGPTGFDRSGKTLYLIASRFRNTAAMTSVDLDTGAKTVLAESDLADASDAMVHPTTRHIEAVAFTHERKEWQVLAESVAGDLNFLKSEEDGDVEVVSRTLNDDMWIVAYRLDDGPVKYHLYRRSTRRLEYLFSNYAELETAPLAKMQPVIIESRDGLDLVSYYTLPAESLGKNPLYPTRPLPTVLLVHGGPWARADWGYDPHSQWLADRGYAALVVNFRGSTGLGKNFINAGNLEWGRKMHDDLLDAVNWAIDAGIADSQKIAVMGGSYGGYAALASLTFTPDVFACAVDIVGPSNLLTLLESFPPYWQPMIELFTSRVGDHRTREGRALLQERSPLSYVDRIQRPLLIGQGANDPRVTEAESAQIVQAMGERDIPVTYVLYPDEGHGFARPENRLSFYAIAEAFLAQHLGGRFEEIGNDLECSSISVKEGIDEVSGLAEALRKHET